jgi:hypothetical protein
MSNISKGAHTFAFFQRLCHEDYESLQSDFNMYMNSKKEMNRYPIKDNKNPKIIRGWEYFYKPGKGIRWRLGSIEVNYNLTVYGLLVIISPKVLTDNNYLAVATEKDIDKVEVLFNEEAAKISPMIFKFGLCSASRADPCLNLDLRELNYPCSPEQALALIKRGDIPKHYKERKKYDKAAHRMKAANDSFYLESGSANVNYYLKSEQLNKKFSMCPQKEDAGHTIRLEIQCKYLKLYSLSKKLRHTSKFHIPTDELSAEEICDLLMSGIKDPAVPIDIILSNKISNEVIDKFFYKIARKGNYFTLDGARWMVEKHKFRRDKEDRLIYALELVNNCRGIAKAKAELCGVDLCDFKRSLKDLDDILVNPVTIPRKWGIKYIPNLLTAYYNSTYERFMFENEFLFSKYLGEYLAG